MCAKCGPILDTISHQPAITFRVRMDFFLLSKELNVFSDTFYFQMGPDALTTFGTIQLFNLINILTLSIYKRSPML